MSPRAAETMTWERGDRPRTYVRGREGIDELTKRVIGAAMAVHRALGPGMLESVYHSCIREELRARSIRFASEVSLPIRYGGTRLDDRFRLDLVVEDVLIVELKSVDRIAPVHLAQLLTYLKLSGFQRGLLINFNVERLALGVRRVTTTNAVLGDPRRPR